MTEDGGEVEVVVVYEYAAQLPDELSLRVGDVIQRVERLEGGWWRGQLAGRHGMFPDNFVKVGNISTTRNIVQCMLYYHWIHNYSSLTAPNYFDLDCGESRKW